MTLRKRGSVWYYDFMMKGRRYRDRVPEARTKSDALTAESNARMAVFQGAYGKPVGSDSFSSYADNVYLPWAQENKRSWKSDEYHVRVLKAYFDGKTFADFSRLLIEKFKKDRRSSQTKAKRTRAAASVNREIACLSKIFTLAVRDGAAASNPCLQVPKLRENNKRYRYLTVEEEDRLLAALTGQRAHLRPIITVAIHTGGRRGELLNLRWEYVDFTQEIILLTDTKTGKDRAVPMNEVVKSTLLELQGTAGDSEYVFKSPKTGGRLTEVKHGFVSACQDARVDDFHFHDLRHTFGTRLGEKGVDAFTIAQLMGHADLRMTARYTHATNKNLRRAVQSLSEGNVAEKNCHRIVTNFRSRVS